MHRSIEPDNRIQILSSAIDGEHEAQRAILDFFDSYINALATVTVYYKEGQSRTFLDVDIKIEIQATLLEAVKRFGLDEILNRNRGKKRTKGFDHTRCLENEMGFEEEQR